MWYLLIWVVIILKWICLNCSNAKAAHHYKQSTRGQVSKGVQIPKTKRGFFGIVTVFILSKYPWQALCRDPFLILNDTGTLETTSRDWQQELPTTHPGRPVISDHPHNPGISQCQMIHICWSFGGAFLIKLTKKGRKSRTLPASSFVGDGHW